MSHMQSWSILICIDFNIKLQYLWTSHISKGKLTLTEYLSIYHGSHCIRTEQAEPRSEIDCSPNRELIKIINVIWKITSYMESEGETTEWTKVFWKSVINFNMLGHENKTSYQGIVKTVVQSECRKYEPLCMPSHECSDTMIINQARRERNLRNYTMPRIYWIRREIRARSLRKSGLTDRERERETPHLSRERALS